MISSPQTTREPSTTSEWSDQQYLRELAITWKIAYKLDATTLEGRYASCGDIVPDGFIASHIIGPNR